MKRRALAIDRAIPRGSVRAPKRPIRKGVCRMGNDFYDNRELSWLKFNERVLEEARDSDTPLFERLRFVQIFCSNLDEFFMIRVGSLNDKMMFAPKERDNKTNMTAKEQLSAIAKRVR